MTTIKMNKHAIEGLAVTGILVVAASVLFFADSRLSSSPNSQLLTGAQALEMRQVYLSQCATCHGERGQGGESGVDFTSAPSVASLSRKQMTTALKKRHNGRLEGDLSKLQVESVTDFIREYLMLPAPFADASAGRRIYSEGCSVCHGERGDGASWAQNSLFPAPLAFSDADPELLTREDMIAAVTFGKPDTAMMPFATQFTPEEIAATVDYIRLAFMSEQPKLTDAAVSPEVGKVEPSPSQKSTTTSEKSAIISGGNKFVGGALYRINCVQCHGEKGDGQGRRAYFMVKKPADFTTAAFRMRMNRERLYTAIARGVVGSPMPAWDTVLPPEKIADLAAYMNDTFIESPANNGVGWQATPAKKKD